MNPQAHLGVENKLASSEANTKNPNDSLHDQGYKTLAQGKRLASQ